MMVDSSVNLKAEWSEPQTVDLKAVSLESRTADCSVHESVASMVDLKVVASAAMKAVM